MLPGVSVTKEMHVPGKSFSFCFRDKDTFRCGGGRLSTAKSDEATQLQRTSHVQFRVNGSHESPEKSVANCRKQFVSLSTWNGFHPNTTLDVEIKLKTDKVFVFGASAMEFSFVRGNAFVKSEASHENFARRYVVSIDLRKSNPKASRFVESQAFARIPAGKSIFNRIKRLSSLNL